MQKFELMEKYHKNELFPCKECKAGQNSKYMFCKVWVETEGDPAECKRLYFRSAEKRNADLDSLIESKNAQTTKTLREYAQSKCDAARQRSILHKLVAGLVNWL